MATMQRREEELELEKLEADYGLVAIFQLKREAEKQAFKKSLTANELEALDILDTMAKDAQESYDQINDHQTPPARAASSKNRKIIEEDDSEEDKTPPARAASSKRRKIIEEDQAPPARAASKKGKTIDEENSDEDQARPARAGSKKRKVVEEDNSKETLDLIKEWIKTASPPQNPFGQQFSKPIRKQLTESDTKQNQNRLMLGRHEVEKLMFPHFKESELQCGKEGIEVLVFGPDGKSQEMMFKMWNEKTPVLACGWHKFVSKHELEMHSDFLTLSVFRHIETDQICFTIDSKKFSAVRKALSRRIVKLAFNGDS